MKIIEWALQNIQPKTVFPAPQRLSKPRGWRVARAGVQQAPCPRAAGELATRGVLAWGSRGTSPQDCVQTRTLTRVAEKLLCRAALFSLGSLDFLALQIIVF